MSRGQVHSVPGVVCAVGWEFREAEQRGAVPGPQKRFRARWAGCRAIRQLRGRRPCFRIPLGRGAERGLGLLTCRLTSQPEWSWGPRTDLPRLLDCSGSGFPQLPQLPRALSDGTPSLRQAQAQSSQGWQCCLQYRPCKGRRITSQDGRLITYKALLESSDSEQFASQVLTQPGVWVGSSEPNSAFLLQVTFKEESK